MQLSYKQLASHLTKNLSRIYLVTGNEMFLQHEASRKIWLKAKESGITERKILHDAEGLAQIGAGMETMSLFAESTLYEVRFNTSLKKTDGDRIVEWCQSNSDDTLVIVAPQVEKPAQRSAWFKALQAEINQAGAWLTIWPVKVEEFPAWLFEQATAKGLEIEPAAINALAERTEGNLQAADQALERLTLIYDKSAPINLEKMLQYTSDNARFGAFEMLDTCLMGDARKTVRMLLSLKEQANPVQLLGSVVISELRKLCGMAWQLEQGEQTTVVFRKFGVWQAKQRVYNAALKRYPCHVWQSLLERSLSLDKIIKGQQTGDAWLVLESTLLVMAGKKQFAKGIPAGV